MADVRAIIERELIESARNAVADLLERSHHASIVMSLGHKAASRLIRAVNALEALEKTDG